MLGHKDSPTASSPEAAPPKRQEFAPVLLREPDQNELKLHIENQRRMGQRTQQSNCRLVTRTYSTL